MRSSGDHVKKIVDHICAEPDCLKPYRAGPNTMICSPECKRLRRNRQMRERKARVRAPLSVRECGWCGTSFMAKRVTHIWCKTLCGVEAHRIIRRLRKFNLSQERFDELNTGFCAICGTTEPGHVGGWCVDHDHACCPTEESCGRCVMWFACTRCNLRLFGDDTTRHRKFADMIDEHRAQRSALIAAEDQAA